MLKTNFKDEILPEGQQYRKYNIVGEDGRVIQSNIHLVKSYSPKQEGDKYGALEINTLNKDVNGKQNKVLDGLTPPDPLLGEDGDMYLELEA